MFDKNTNIGQLIKENPQAAEVLISYGIPCYGNLENQLSSIEDASIRYRVDMNSMLNKINNHGNNTGLW